MEIITAIQKDSHIAFTEAFHTFHKKVFRFYLKRVELHDIAKDLTQQCFARLWEYRKTLSLDHPFEKQLFIIARSILYNHLKKEVSLRNVKEKYGSIHDGMSSEEDISSFVASDLLNAALQQLPPVRKKIIRLKLVDGFSNKEIAEQLSISVKTVENHVNRAFKHLKQVDVKAVALLVVYLLK